MIKKKELSCSKKNPKKHPPKNVATKLEGEGADKVSVAGLH